MSIVENKKAKSILAFLTIVLILLGIIVPALAAMEQLSPTSNAPNILAPAPTITLFPRVG